ncbi:MAG: hypothetical protein JXQ67_07000 [Campylobacterales bacterium]|nr:hypothetical protein [Campylobacterales bacterium]
MSEAYLHQKLLLACGSGNIVAVKEALDAGANPNFNIKKVLNPLEKAIERDNHEIITLLLEHGAIVKANVLQKAIEKDTKYLEFLLPDFSNCSDKTLLMGVLQAAINSSNVSLAKMVLNQGANPASLLIYDVRNIDSPELLELLIQNGLNIHAENNMLLSEWMGSSSMSGGEKWKDTNEKLLAFLFEYYMQRPEAMKKFESLKSIDKKRLFQIGLFSNNLTMMQFAILIGADKNEALSTVYSQYNANKDGNIGSIYSILYTNNEAGIVNEDIVKYILDSGVEFSKTTIARAVQFSYQEVLDALSCMDDLEYGYEMAYRFDNTALGNYFVKRGVSPEVQSYVAMKVSAITGDIQSLRKAIHEGADVQALASSVIVEILNKNQRETLEYLYDSGVIFEESLSKHLHDALNYHSAYESVAYFIELGFDISGVKNIPPKFKERYRAYSDMWERRVRDVYAYTIYLVKDIYPKLEGKEQERVLNTIAQLSSLPYVIQKSQERVEQ